MTRVKRGVVTKRRHKRLLKKQKVSGDNAKTFLCVQKKH